MGDHPVSREDILASLKRELESLPFVDAFWEAGAAAFERVDAWSDLDLQIVCDDGSVEQTLTAARKAVEAVGAIDGEFRMPEPAWHGHSQVFWRVRGASPFHLVDLCVIKRSADDKFLEVEMHGRPNVLFDKTGVSAPAPFDAEAHRKTLRGRLGTLRAVFDLFGRVMVEKEINRGNAVEAMTYFHGTTVRPLIEVLRMRYAPAQHRFHTRYVYYDFPPEVVRRLETMFFVQDMGELAKRLDDAVAWFAEAAADAERLLSDDSPGAGT
jgi:hypothetical protein